MAKAVDTAFALLVAGGIPGRVVLNDGVRELLEVDAFGEAIGGDQDALGGFAQLGDAGFAFFRRDVAGDGVDGVVREGLGEGGAQVFGGGDEAAENDGRETVVEKLLDDGFDGGELGVLAGWRSCAGTAQEVGETGDGLGALGFVRWQQDHFNSLRGELGLAIGGGFGAFDGGCAGGAPDPG